MPEKYARLHYAHRPHEHESSDIGDNHVREQREKNQFGHFTLLRSLRFLLRPGVVLPRPNEKQVKFIFIAIKRTIECYTFGSEKNMDKRAWHGNVLEVNGSCPCRGLL